MAMRMNIVTYSLLRLVDIIQVPQQMVGDGTPDSNVNHTVDEPYSITISHPMLIQCSCR